MSQTYLSPKIIAKAAGADLTTHQYKLVKLGADNDSVVLCGNAEKPMGVLMNAPNTGELAEVAVAGGAKVKIASTISISSGVLASCASAANGVGRAGVSTEFAIGVFTDSGVSGDIIPIIIGIHTV
jgi:hypothetical protein